MTTIQETKLNMYLAVRDFLIPNEPVTKELPNFTENVNALKETIVTLQAIAEQQKFDKKGLAKLKKELREKLILLSVDNSRKIIAYAKFSKNTLLQNDVKFTSSRFSKMTDTGLKDYAQIVYDKAQTNIDALPAYGINAETQKTFLETLTAYNESISKPRVGIAERSQFTKQLVTLFEKADILLGNLDLATEIIRLPQKNFYDGYKTARKIVETSSGNLKLKALVTDKITMQPLGGVFFNFKPVSNTPGSLNGNGEITKKSSEKGRFNIKSMPAGTYKLNISKPGYADKSGNVIVEEGIMTDLRVELEKV